MAYLKSNPNMKLTDHDYQELKKDEFISSAIVMLKDIMRKTPDSRLDKIKSCKEFDKREITLTINALEKVVKNSLLIDILRPIMPELKTVLKKLKKDQNLYFKLLGKRAGHQIERNSWLKSIFYRLAELGVEAQSSRVEFIYRLFIEYDFDGCHSAYESENTPDNILDKFDEANMKRGFRLIDKEASKLI